MTGRLLITGASGFVGFHLVEEALRQGLEVFAAVRSSSKVDHLKALPVRFTTLNFADRNALQRELEEKEYDYIVHAAGATKASSEKEYLRINADFTRNLAAAAAEQKHPLKKFVFLSSLAAAGPSHSRAPIAETDAANPVTYYGQSKLQAEAYLSKITTLPVLTLRPTAVYGPRDRDIFILLKTISRGLEPYIGRQGQQLSFVYVKDLAAIAIGALGSNISGKRYNVSDGVCYDRYALATITKKVLQKKTLRFHLPVSVVRAMARLQVMAGRVRGTVPALNPEKMPELTAANWSCSIESIRKDLAFTPQYTLETGLPETIRWYKENQWL